MKRFGSFGVRECGGAGARGHGDAECGSGRGCGGMGVREFESAGVQGCRSAGMRECRRGCERAGMRGCQIREELAVTPVWSGVDLN